MKTYYILDTSWGFGVYRNGWLIREFDTYSEADEYKREKEREDEALYTLMSK